MGGKRTRRSFSREVKLEAVRQVVEEGRTQKSVGEELGVNVNVLDRWVREFREDPTQSFPGNGTLKARDKEVEELRRGNARLKGELGFFGKSLCVLRQGPAMRYVLIAELGGDTPKRWLCSAMSVSERGFRAWRKRGESDRVKTDRRLLIDIRSGFEGSRRTYGSPRIESPRVS